VAEDEASAVNRKQRAVIPCGHDGLSFCAVALSNPFPSLAANDIPEASRERRCSRKPTTKFVVAGYLGRILCETYGYQS
jgi:hypothetical protein